MGKKESMGQDDGTIILNLEQSQHDTITTQKGDFLRITAILSSLRSSMHTVKTLNLQYSGDTTVAEVLEKVMVEYNLSEEESEYQHDQIIVSICWEMGENRGRIDQQQKKLKFAEIPQISISFAVDQFVHGSIFSRVGIINLKR